MLDRVTEAVVENRPWLQKHLRIVAIGLARTAAIVVPHLQVAHLQRPGCTADVDCSFYFEVRRSLFTPYQPLLSNAKIPGQLMNTGSVALHLAVMVMVLDRVTPSASNQTYSAKTSGVTVLVGNPEKGARQSGPSTLPKSTKIR